MERNFAIRVDVRQVAKRVYEVDGPVSHDRVGDVSAIHGLRVARPKRRHELILSLDLEREQAASFSNLRSSLGGWRLRGDVTIFAQPHPKAVAATWDEVRDQLAGRFPKIGTLMDAAKAEVLAFTAFPPTALAQDLEP
jgi:hypothetical protein